MLRTAAVTGPPFAFGLRFAYQRGSMRIGKRRPRPVTPTIGHHSMVPSVPTPKPGVLEIDPYVPGESQLASGAKPIKLSSNETPLGPSAKAIAAFAASVELERYPDGGATRLREAIADVHGLHPDRIVCGAGSDELLGLMALGYLGPGDEAIYTAHGFMMYPIIIRAHGGMPVIAPETNHCADVDAILAKVSDRTKMVFIANPNNPTGTYLPVSEIRRLRAGLPGHVLLIIDAAYGEYVRRNDYETGIELVASTENTVMTRTFSKVHGLAALRLGWCYGPAAIVDVLHRIRGPFNVASPALAAGVAAIEDRDHVEASVRHNDRWRAWLDTEISRLGLSVTPSVGNFVLIHFPALDAARSAVAADEFLKRRNIILRRTAGYGLPDALRMTVGTEDDNRSVVAALAEFIEQAEK